MLVCFILLSSSAIPLAPNFPVLYWDAFTGNGDEWEESEAPNYSRAWAIEETDYPQTHKGERALVEASGRGFSAVSTRFPKPINVENKTLVLQYEMRSQWQPRCFTAGVKLFSDPAFDPKTLTNETEYTILFGPDICAYSRVSFELGYRDPATNRVEVQNFTDSPRAPKDRRTHLFTLIVRPDASFALLVDNVVQKEGNLFYDMSPGLPRGAAQAGLDLKAKEFTGIGFEVFDVDYRLAYSKILIATDEEAVKKFNEESFLPRREFQLSAKPEADINEEERERAHIPKKEPVKLGFSAALLKAAVAIGDILKELLADFSPAVQYSIAAVPVLLLLLCCCFGRRKEKAD